MFSWKQRIDFVPICIFIKGPFMNKLCGITLHMFLLGPLGNRTHSLSISNDIACCFPFLLTLSLIPLLLMFDCAHPFLQFFGVLFVLVWFWFGFLPSRIEFLDKTEMWSFTGKKWEFNPIFTVFYLLYYLSPSPENFES